MRNKNIMPRATMISSIHISSFPIAENSLLYCILRHACKGDEQQQNESRDSFHNDIFRRDNLKV
jgi:hypothetical protein